MQPSVLVVDDRAAARRALAGELADAGFRVHEAEDGREAYARFRERGADLVLADLVMPRSDGIELLARIRARSDVPVLLFTAYGSVESAVAALRGGADDFVASEAVEIDELVRRAERLVRRRAPEGLRPALAERLPGESAAIRRVRDQIAGLAPLREPVLVSGEPGSGRHTAVRALHELGATADGALRVLSAEAVSAGGLPLGERGALYLEELDRAPAALQRELAERWRELREHGGTPRLFASARRPRAAALAEGALDRSLAETALRFEVALPPLRERPEDVPRIARALLARIARELGRPEVALEPGAEARLRAELWPGNAAELRSFLERLVAYSPQRRIARSDVAALLAEERESLARIRERRAAEEREALLDALRRTGGNVTHAAEALGRSRAAVYRLAAKHGVPLHRER